MSLDDQWREVVRGYRTLIIHRHRRIDHAWAAERIFKDVVCVSPGAIATARRRTFPVSIQHICKYSSSPKSFIRFDLSIHGFQTIVDSEPSELIWMVRFHPESINRISDALPS